MWQPGTDRQKQYSNKKQIKMKKSTWLLLPIIVASCSKDELPSPNISSKTSLNATALPKPDTVVASKAEADKLVLQLNTIYKKPITTPKMSITRPKTLADPEDGEGGGGGQWYVTFYVDLNWPASNFEITIFYNTDENGYTDVISVQSDTWGYGMGGEYNQTNSYWQIRNNGNGSTITFTADGHQTSVIGFGRLTQNYGADPHFSGWINIDPHGNPTTGQATVGPKFLPKK